MKSSFSQNGGELSISRCIAFYIFIYMCKRMLKSGRTYKHMQDALICTGCDSRHQHILAYATNLLNKSWKLGEVGQEGFPWRCVWRSKNRGGLVLGKQEVT